MWYERRPASRCRSPQSGQQRSQVYHRSQMQCELSDSDHASIDEQFDRVDEAAVVRGEKYDGFGDFVRFARAPQRDLGGHLGGKSLDLFFGQAALVVSRRDNYPRAHSVDADLAIFQIIGPATGETAHRGLGSGIDAEVWHAL